MVLLKQTTYTLKFYNPSHLTYTLLKLINLVKYIPLTNAWMHRLGMGHTHNINRFIFNPLLQ